MSCGRVRWAAAHLGAEPEVDEHQPAGAVDQQVAGVRVRVEETVLPGRAGVTARPPACRASLRAANW